MFKSVPIKLWYNNKTQFNYRRNVIYIIINYIIYKDAVISKHYLPTLTYTYNILSTVKSVFITYNTWVYLYK